MQFIVRTPVSSFGPFESAQKAGEWLERNYASLAGEVVVVPLKDPDAFEGKNTEAKRMGIGLAAG